MKKILLVHKHFYPDTPPYASMLAMISKHLASKGNDVSVFTAQPSYGNKKREGKSVEVMFNLIKVKRVYLLFNLWGSKISLALDMIYFPFRVFLEVLFGRYDVVSVSTVPQVTLGFFSMLACKISRAKLIYHCMDIHPEIGKLSGEFSNPFVYKLLSYLDSRTVKYADQIIVLSSDMKRSLSRGGSPYSGGRVMVVNNLSLDTVSRSIEDSIEPDKYLKESDSFRLIFAGNIGRFQGLEVLVEAFNLLDIDTNLELVFLGEGKAKNRLERISCHPKIKFFAHVDIPTARKIIGEADLGIVSLSPQIIKYAFPSKTSTYLDLGVPVFSIVEESDLADMILSNGVGIVSNSTVQDVLHYLNVIESGSIDFSLLRKNAKSLYNTDFCNDVILSKWERIIKDI